MKYKVTHRTSYAYSEPVPVCQNQVLLTPRDGPQQRCRSHRLLIRPTPTTSSRRRDSFGNQIHTFAVETAHRKLSITATSRVEVQERTLPEASESPTWESVVDSIAGQTAEDWFEACQFVYDSPAITRSQELARYAQAVFKPKRPILQCALDLTRKIHDEFEYDKQATHVGTKTEEAFRLRGGVCQDFAHIQIGCLRSLGIPARYVSGYLRTTPPPGEPRRAGQDESHAWLSVYCGPLGWIDFDPTNAIPSNTDHVTVAWGRDYFDVAPIRGTFLGGGTHKLTVSVDVDPLSSDSESPSTP